MTSKVPTRTRIADWVKAQPRRQLTGARRRPLPRLAALIAVAALIVVVAPRCRASSYEYLPAPIVLSHGNGCHETFFWAATERGDAAVTVAVDLKPSPAGPTTVTYRVPDSRADVEVVRGTNLPRNFCNDQPVEASEPTSRTPVSSGTITINLDALEPGDRCGTIHATMHLGGMMSAEGAYVPELDVATEFIGCYL